MRTNQGSLRGLPVNPEVGLTISQEELGVEEVYG